MTDKIENTAEKNYGEQNSTEGISIIDLLIVIIDNLKLIVTGSLVFGIIILGYGFTITPSYTAKTLFLPPQQQQSSAVNLISSLSALGGMASLGTALKSPSEQYVSFLKSYSLRDALITKFNLKEKYKLSSNADARQILEGSTRIVLGKDGIISIEVDDSNPKFAADLANAYVEEFGILLGRLALTEAQQRRVFFEKQLQISKENFVQADLALKSTGINSSVLKSSPASALEAVARLKANISVQEVKLGSMRNYLTENSPEFKLVMNELYSLRLQLSKIEKYEPTVSGGGDYLEKFRDFKYRETILELFIKQYEMAKIDESREGAFVQVLDFAEPPERKTKPLKAIMSIIATLASGCALVIFVLVRFIAKRTLQEPKTKIQLEILRVSLRRAIGI
jgi:tyrosine-protein kinase Etk/Wzc